MTLDILCRAAIPRPLRPRPSRASALRLALAFGFLLALYGHPVAAQSPTETHFDWPVGQCVDGKRVLSQNYKIQQEFDNLRGPGNWAAGTRCNTTYHCWHAGLDIHRTDANESLYDPVFAMADGRVAGTASYSSEGEMVILEHALDDGTTVYTQYGHLQEVWVVENQPVRRGQPLGRIMDYPYGTCSNDHVHVEVRETLQVGTCPSGGSCGSLDYTASGNRSCAGNGYSLVTPNTASNLETWGFMDPVDMYFGYRPDSPAWIVGDQANDRLRTSPMILDNNIIDGRSFDPGVPTLSQAVAATLDDADGDLDIDEDIEIGWYQLPSDDVDGDGDEDEVWTGGYVEEGYGSILRIGEAWRVGREWTPPSIDDEDRPLVIDYRFEPSNERTCTGSGCDVDAVLGCTGTAQSAEQAALSNCTCTLGSLINHAADDADGTVIDEVALTVPYDALLDQPDGNDICDLVGRFDDSGHVELELDEDVNVHGGVAVELEMLLDTFTEDGEQVLAGQWPESDDSLGDRQWKLAITTETVAGELKGTLRFTVRQANGVDLELAVELDDPECLARDSEYDTRCDDDTDAEFTCDGTCDAATLHEPARARCVSDFGYRQWLHVAAVYDTETATAELYLDGAKRAEAAGVTLQIASGGQPIRVGAGVRSRLDNVQVWARPADVASSNADSVLILDSSGSMRGNDPNDQRKSAAKLFLNVVPQGDKVAAIDFDGVIQDQNEDVKDPYVTEERAEILRVINGVNSSGSTNIGLAIDTACDILNRDSAENPVKAAILLTDGQGSVSNTQKDCFLYDPDDEDGNDWSLHALGFGGASQAQLNAIIAGTSPRSTADIVGSAEAVLCRMLQLRAELEGRQAQPCAELEIRQGETLVLEQTIDGLSRVTFSIAWPGSDVVMTLITPSGRVIGRDVDAPDVVHAVGPTFESYTIDCPEDGVWTIELYGADIPAAVEPVVFGTSEIEGGSCAAVEACGVDALGAAGGFNAFVVGDVAQDHTHIGGRVAAGGNVDFEHVFVGAQLGAGELGGEALVAGAHLRFDHGRVQGGDVVYGLSADVSAPTAIVDGVVRQGTPIGFAAAGSRLVALAARVSALPATADPQIDRKGNITLIGLDEQRNVFHVGAEQLADAKIVLINVPSTSTAVVVVDGASVVLDDLIVKLRGGADAARIAWSLPDALDLLIAVNGVSLPGAVLAPRALVDFAHGRVDGTLVGAALYGDGKLDHVPFEGCLPQP